MVHVAAYEANRLTTLDVRTIPAKPSFVASYYSAELLDGAYDVAFDVSLDIILILNIFHTFCLITTPASHTLTANNQLCVRDCMDCKSLVYIEVV